MAKSRGNFVTSYHSNDEIQTQISLSGSGCKTIEIENTGLEEIREVHSINIGNPHAVTFVNNIHNLDVDSIGSAISKSQEFPEGVNVGFCQVVDRGFYDCEYLNAESAKRWHAALEPVPLLLSQRRRS